MKGVSKMPKKQAHIDFKMYIDRLEHDRIESEKRSLALEQRLTANAEKMEQRIREERIALEQRNQEREQRNQEREQRIREEHLALEQRNQEREQRNQEREQRIREEHLALEQRLTENAAKMEERFNANAVRMESKIDNFVKETKTSNRWFFALNTAALISVAGIIIAFINLLVNGNADGM